MENDLFDHFVDNYEKGAIQQALQDILTHPDIAYDSLSSYSNRRAFQFLVNYCDACASKGIVEAHETNQTLQEFIKNDKHLKIILERFLDVLSYEKNFIQCYFAQDLKELKKNSFSELKAFFDYLFQPNTLDHQDLKSFVDAFPSFYQDCMYLKIQTIQNWKRFQQAKPDLSHIIGGENAYLEQPWHLFSYHITPSLPLLENQEATPLIFLDPLANFDYASFLAPYRSNPAVYVFETYSHFFQLLQFSEVAEILNLPHSLIYILDIYPNIQWLAQKSYSHQLKPLKPLFMTKRSILENVISLFIDVLQRCLSQSKDDFKRETPVANWLYQLAKRILFNTQALRYGKSRFIALKVNTGYQNWHDPHKGLPPPQADLGPPEIDYFKEMIDHLNRIRQVRSFQPKQKIKLVHIVPQVVDGGHAPSRLLRVLLTFMDSSWFSPYLISTEKFASHLLEYPTASYSSPSSEIRASHTLEYFREKKVKIFINNIHVTYEHTAKYTSEFLKQIQADIVVFHGPDEVNSLCASMTDTPIRVLFDHGTLPSYPCFDLAILSSEETFKMQRENLRKMGIESCALPFAVDVRFGWDQRIYSKEELGFPSDSFLMTTISNHLSARLSNEMCHAIGEILQRCPQAYYVPIGPITSKEKFRVIFEEYGVNDRVIFLGHKAHPSQYARSMDLYLNEFPFGSGLGLLDAMAAGCPVVSMYDEQGPQQARYGATYFGMDHVITTGKREDYVDLACRLIQNPKFHKEWSEYAKQQYEKHVDLQKYVKTFELILERFIEYKQKSPYDGELKNNPHEEIR